MQWAQLIACIILSVRKFKIKFSDQCVHFLSPQRTTNTPHTKMAPTSEQQSSSVSQQCGVPQILEGPDGERLLRVLSSVPADTRARQIAVRPQEDRLLIFRVGGAEKEGMLHHELLESVQLPESVDPFTVVATINNDGLLEVSAPLTH